MGKLYSKTEKNGEGPIWYQSFKIYEISSLNYLNIFSCTTFARVEGYVDEFSQPIKVDRTPGVSRVIISSSRIMV